MCWGCLSPLKNPLPRPCLNSRHLGQVANTITTTPPRWLYNKAFSAEFITFNLDTFIYVVSLVGMINENIVRFIHTLLYNSSLYKFWLRSYRKGLKNTNSVYWRFTYADSLEYFIVFWSSYFQNRIEKADVYGAINRWRRLYRHRHQF
jgi:hypothetical protein